MLDRNSGERAFSLFRDLPRFLRPGDLLVLNETRVLPARLFARLERTGRAVEVMVSHFEEGTMHALLGSSRRIRTGDRLALEGRDEVLELEAAEGNGLFRLRVAGEGREGGAGGEGGASGGIGVGGAGGASRVEQLLREAGHVPLPPYLGREDVPADRDWYQTVYARSPGAVAAPTAGLHFTEALLARIEEMGVKVTRVVLHVGPGTFLPVRAAVEGEHRVLPERYEIGVAAVEAIARARAESGRVIAVGTTTVRVLETAGPEPSPGSGWTGLTILPGFRFRAVDALITNFHLPRSSLLLLVAAFAGREAVLGAYAEARDAGFRFYSYGDAMFICGG